MDTEGFTYVMLCAIVHGAQSRVASTGLAAVKGKLDGPTALGEILGNVCVTGDMSPQCALR